MSGGYDNEAKETSEAVKEVMGSYAVDEKTAVRIVADRNVFALRMFARWRENIELLASHKETKK
jgi:hypothetical protein